ncbi:MAG: hypothetical protein MJ138_01870 [Kiritimatiellae bacterium]|nr:hypothetical protein [Kiritimatiellia bacterium]
MSGNDNVEELASAPVGRLILKYSWPALVAMALNALYSVVDRFYIGQGCGEDAMAALTLTFPVMMLFGAFGVFIGAGHAAVLSIKLGENDRVACEKILGELVFFKLLFFFVLPPIVFFNLDAVLGWCGGGKVTPAAFAGAKTYLQIVLFSHVFSHLAFGLSAAMRAEGSAVPSMNCMIVGFGANMLLDPLFIFGFKMGVAGAAIATNAAMAASCFWALAHYWRGKSAVRLRWRRIWVYREFAWRASTIGFAPFLQNLLGAAINMSLAAAFALWSPDEKTATMQIASLGVFQGVLILTLMPMLGAQQGLQPIFGYNWGARNFARVKETFVLGFWVTTAICVVATVVQVVPPLPTWLARIFVGADNPALLATAARDLQVSNCMIWTIGVNVVATTYFQSIGHPWTAVFLSTLRQGLCLLPCIWILPHFMENHVVAIWLSLPISDVVCQLATLVPLRSQFRFLGKVRRRRD